MAGMAGINEMTNGSEIDLWPSTRVLFEGVILIRTQMLRHKHAKDTKFMMSFFRNCTAQMISEVFRLQARSSPGTQCTGLLTPEQI